MLVKEALESWASLNTFLRSATEEDAKKVLDAEKKGARRELFLLRAHARFNRERAQRERKELQAIGVAAK
jgi:hypothetical protein